MVNPSGLPDVYKRQTMKICLVRIYYGIIHAALVGEIGNLNLAQKANGIAFQSRLVDDTGILQDLLFEADAAQKLALLTLGCMLLEILTEVDVYKRQDVLSVMAAHLLFLFTFLSKMFGVFMNY